MSQKPKSGQDKTQQTKAPEATGATDVGTTQGTATTEAATTATGASEQATANAGAQTNDASQAPASSEAKPQDNNTADNKEKTGDAPMSIFDQAVQFSLPDADETKTAEAQELWESLICDEMPAALAVAVFDCGVDQGLKVAERLFGKIEHHLDKPAGPETEAEAITDFLAWRLRRYAFTANAASKMHGWAHHMMRLQAFILTELEA